MRTPTLAVCAASLWATAAALAAFPALGPDAGAAPAPSDETIRQFVKDLGASDWRTREDAQRRLLDLGPRSAPALREALASSDQEAAGRAREILDAVDPIETALVLVRIELPFGGAPWQVTEKAFFRGRNGRIGGRAGSSYLIALDGDDPARARISLRTTTSGSMTPLALNLAEFECETWCLVEERATTQVWQEGVHMECDRRTSVLLVWAAITKLLDSNAGARPLDTTAPDAVLKTALSESLLAQLAGHRALTARLTAGHVLSRLGDTRAIRGLEPLAGEDKADAALVRLGAEEAVTRLAANFERNARIPDDEDAALALAARGHPVGVRVVAEHILEFSQERHDEALWLLAGTLRSAPAHTPIQGALEFLADNLRDDHMAWNTAARFLLFATALHAEGGRALLPPLKQGLADVPTPNTATSSQQVRLQTLRVLLSRGAVPRTEIESCAALLAPHARGPYWYEAVLSLPYLCETGGTAVLRPFIAEARSALVDERATYYLKNLLWALVMLAPRSSPEAAELQALLQDALAGTLPAAPATPSSTAALVRPQRQASLQAVLEPLAFLLRVPLAGDNAAGIAQLTAMLKAGQLPGTAVAPGASDDAHELSLWTLLHRDDTTTVRDAQHVALRMYETACFRDGFGNLRIVALAPPSYAPQRKGEIVQILTPGGPRTVRLNEPVVTTFFPDSTVKTLSGSSADIYERYEQASFSNRTLLCVRPGADARGPVPWEQAVAELVATLESSDQNKIQSTLRLLMDLKLKEAVPALRALFARRPTLDVAETLAALDDATGEALFLTNLRTGQRQEKIRAITYFLGRDPSHREAAQTLEELLRAATENDIYALMTPVRHILAAETPHRERILATLATLLTTKNVSPLIYLLREGTGLDFGYEEALQAGLSNEEREARLARIVSAWKDALTPRPTDKRAPAPPPQE